MTAKVRDNGLACQDWLFGLDFGSKEFGYSGGSTGIPAGGKVPSDYLSIDASDIVNRHGTRAAFFGYTGRDEVKIVGRAKDGRRFVVWPRLAPARLRRRYDWLRGFRYFVFFHSGSSLIESLSVFARNGKLLETAENAGLFFD